ncbi:MAG TPA: very short patch repair endonuclease [Methanosarcina sp.]|jgi:DNA mismatch endonuclease (patch repair protein)|nr:very short patch repair endonuclease [Methanosarcina sp.]
MALLKKNTDVNNTKTRIYNMLMIKGKSTNPEVIIRKFLYSKEFRFRINYFTLPKNKAIIFINGCFRYGNAGCKYFVIPKTRTEWWNNKINNTKKSGRIKSSLLKELSWNIVIWECGLQTVNFENSFNEQLLKLKVKY